MSDVLSLASDDAGLVERSRAGDRQAFGRIVERYQSLVASIVYSSIGDLALSQDIAQDTFLAAWRGLGGLREPEKLRSWLAGIARNLAKTALRSRGRAPRVEPLDAAREAAAPQATPLDEVLSREEEALLWRALGAIPEAYRETLVLFYREHQSAAAVAVALELSEEAVKQRLSRGRQMLKDQVSAFVEAGLARTRPGKAFTVAVLAALPALAPQVASAGVATGVAKGAAGKAAAASTALSGAVFGPLLGVLGAYFGIKTSYEAAGSERERQHVRRSTWLFLAYATGFMLLEGLGLTLWRRAIATLSVQVPLLLAYATGLIVLIVRSNRRQRQIRIEEGSDAEARLPDLLAAGVTTATVAGSLGGGIFGSVAWVLPLCWLAGDWQTALLVLGGAGGILAISVRAALRSPGDYFRVAMAAIVAIGGLNVVVLLLKWDEYMVVYRRSLIYQPSGDLPLWAMVLLLVGLVGLLLLRFRFLDRQARERTQPTGGSAS